MTSAVAPGTLRIGIIVLTAATALIHLQLNFPDPVFILNGLGYLTLLAALYLPVPQLALPRLGALGSSRLHGAHDLSVDTGGGAHAHRLHGQADRDRPNCALNPRCPAGALAAVQATHRQVVKSAVSATPTPALVISHTMKALGRRASR